MRRRFALHRLFPARPFVLNILDADYTFLNEPLAKHYAIPMKYFVAADVRRL